SGNSPTLFFERGVGNTLTGNSIPSNVVVYTKGSPAVASVTYISNQPSVQVKVDAYSSVVFSDASGKVFDAGSSTIATTVTPSGSTLTLTQADIGTAARLVTTRPLEVSLSGQSATVTPLLWSKSGGFHKKWTTRASSATLSITYTIGDLAPNTRYTIRKNGVVLETLTADASGFLTFSDVAGTTRAVTYSL